MPSRPTRGIWWMHVQWNRRSLTLRPVRPEDHLQHLAFLERLPPAELQPRVFFSQRPLERSELARLTQIDYAREMAFVAVAENQTLGVVRALSDPDNTTAEFALFVRPDCKLQGLGHLLLNKLVRYTRDQGT